MRKKFKYNLALALGGGGARGLAHIGVLKVIQRDNIKIDLVVGTSMGAIIGAMYSQTGDALAVEKSVLACISKIMQEKRWLNILNFEQEDSKKSLLAEFSSHIKRRYLGLKALTKIALEPKESLYKPLQSLLVDNNIEDTKIPFAAVSLNLVGGETTIFTSGPIIDAVYASSAIEGIFPPLEKDGAFLADGGPVNITPVEVARNLEARRILAVDVYQKIHKMEKFSNGLEVIMRADNIGLNRLRQIDLAEADLVIAPNIGTIHWANFNKAKECIKRGEKAAESMMPLLKQIMKRKTFFNQLKEGAKLLIKDLSE